MLWNELLGRPTRPFMQQVTPPFSKNARWNPDVDQGPVADPDRIRLTNSTQVGG